MPLYSYTCKDCNFTSDFNLSISSFLNSKGSLRCLDCDSKNITRILGSVSSSIEKNIFETKEEIKRDVDLISKKIKSGDQRAIESIYGKE